MWDRCVCGLWGSCKPENPTNQHVGNLPLIGPRNPRCRMPTLMWYFGALLLQTLARFDIGSVPSGRLGPA